MTPLEMVTTVVAEIRDDREDVGLHVTPTRSGIVVIEATRMSHTDCDGCGQGIDTARPGPVDWVDPVTGAIQGGHSHQHGCGIWNSPQSASTTVDLDDVASGAVDLYAAIKEIVAEVDATVAADVQRRTAAIEALLERDLRRALDVLAQGADPADVITGTEVWPGITREEDGALSAWAHPPLPAFDSEIIVVCQDGAAEAAK